MRARHKAGLRKGEKVLSLNVSRENRDAQLIRPPYLPVNAHPTACYPFKQREATPVRVDVELHAAARRRQPEAVARHVDDDRRRVDAATGERVIDFRLVTELQPFAPVITDGRRRRGRGRRGR